MGKRSDFERVPRDFYSTPREAVWPLIPHLREGLRFSEPCAGNGQLIYILEDYLIDGFCEHFCDIEPQVDWIDKEDAMTITAKDLEKCSHIITNPPWTRDILHPMIDRFSSLKPTWLLLDADWAYTKQSSEFMKYCAKIVAVGRVKWIPDSKMTGKDNCAWYLFNRDETPTVFYGR